MRRATLLSVAAGLVTAAEVKLATFDDATGTTWSFKELNDPVMGGQSTGTWHVDTASRFGVFDGDVVNVPSLKAPGFIKAAADGAFPDASGAIGGDLVLVVRSSTPDYAGFRVSFAAGTLSPSYACGGGGSIPLSRGCYKAKFSVPTGGDFVTVRVPLTSFSDKWSPATGEHTAECANEKDVCPTVAALRGIKRVEVWAEGKDGKIHLEVQSISIDGPTAQAAAPLSAVSLAAFDGTGPAFTFKELNDPVMGGQSTGTWHVDAAGHFGVFDGDVVNVPSLKAPGFIKAAADGKFPDASSALGGSLVLVARSSTPQYAGFRVSLAAGTMSPAYACSGGGSIPLSRGCFKAKFSVPAGDDFATIKIPLTSFSDRWSPATGEHNAECSSDKSACLTAKSLAGIKRVELWAEGADGKVHLEVRSISVEAAGTTGSLTGSSQFRPPAGNDTCSGPVQSNLRYGISSRTDPTVPVPVDPRESLAEAVCCDQRTKVYAEPQFLFQAPDILLFEKLKGVTTFYDSVCGVPLFRAPVNRTMEEFQDDTNEHGWPSFRGAEVVKEHVKTDADGFVYSSCGTHLGSYLPDSKGPRWCMDLSCIAGNPAGGAQLLV